MTRAAAGGHEPEDRSIRAPDDRALVPDEHWAERALELGRHALEGVPLARLFDEVAEILVATISASHVGLLRVLPGTEEAVVELSHGWQSVRPGVRIPAGPGTHAGYTARAAEPVIVGDLGADDRFPMSDTARREGLHSAVSTPVLGPDGAWGVLAVHSRDREAFDDADATVLRAVATVLAAAIRRQQIVEELTTRDLVSRLAFEVGRLGAWDWDPATNRVSWSEEMEAVYGLEPGSFDGRFESFVELVHPDDRELVASEIERAVSTGTEIHMEHRIVRPDGSIRWLEGRGRALPAPDSDSTRWIGIGIDITERRIAVEGREALLRSEREARELAEVTSRELQAALGRLDTLLVSAPVGLGFFDLDLRCIRANALLAEISGDPVDEVVGRTARELFPGIEPDITTIARSAIDRRVGLDDVELTGQTASSPGLTRTWLATLRPLSGSEGIVGVSVAVTEITDRKRAELAEHLLHEASELLAAPLDRDEVFARFVRLPVGLLADACTITVARPDGRLEYATVAASDPDIESALRTIEPPSVLETGEETVSARAVRSGLTTRAEWLSDGAHLGPDAPPEAVALAQRMQISSAISVPLRVGGSVAGAYTFLLSQHSQRRYRSADVPLVEEIARHCSDALELAELRGAAARARARLNLLARVGELVQVDLDVSARLQRLTELVLPDLGQTCGAYIAEEEGVRLVAFARSDRPSDSFTSGPIHPHESPLPAVRAIRQAAPVRAELAPELVAAAGTHTVGVVRVAPEIGVSQFLGVPLLSVDTPIGALAFGRREAYDDDDIALASEIARRVAPAVAHAIRFERERDTASVLQRSLLPAALPTNPALRVDARYVSGTAGTRVGGDWYDALELDDGRVLLVIGDVAGHGIGAAALMGQLRTALRVAILDGASPGEMLTRLNRYLATLGPGEMATCAGGIIDPVTGDAVWASAGHPPIAMRDRHGDVAWVAVSNGPPLGAVRDMSYRDSAGEVPPGTTLALYSDGLVERRGEIIDVGFDRLAKALGSAVGPPTAVCDHVIDEMLGGEPPADDVALLVAQLVSSAPLRLVVPSDPRALSETRASMREWLEQHGADAMEIDDIVLATNEALTNAVEHGGRASSDDVVVTATSDEDGVSIEVADRGAWREGSTPGGGRGLQIARALMDDLELETDDTGTRVRMHKALSVSEYAAPADAGGDDRAPAHRFPLTAEADVRVERRGTAAIVALVGDIDLANVDAVDAEIQHAIAPDVQAVVLDLRRTTHLDSSGVRLLFTFAQALEERRMPLALAVADAGIARRVVLLSRIDAAVQQFTTLDEALAAVLAARPGSGAPG